MTVLFVLPDLGPNGAARQVSLVAPALARAGVAVHVAAIGPGDLLAEPLVDAGVPVHFLGATGRYDPGPLLALRRLISELQPDVVHAWRRPALRLAGALHLRRRFPLTAGDLLADRRPGTWLDSRLRKRADRIVVGTPTERAAMQRLGVKDNRLVEIPFAVASRPPPPDRGAVLRELNLPENARLIACAGVMEKNKGFREAVWVFDILKYVYPDLWLLLIGDGSERKEIELFALKAGKYDARVRFAELRDDVPQLLALAEVVWVPGERGGRNVALEALAAGRPVVAADRPELRDLLGPDTGFLVAQTDRHEFAKATRRLLDDPSLRQKCAEAARKRAAEFEVDAVAQKWRDLFCARADSLR